MGGGTAYGSDFTLTTMAPNAITTTYTYDTLGNLTQVTDNKGNTTAITYDWLSRKASMTDLDMGYWAYTYDSNGNLISQRDARGTVLTFTYDALNRMAAKKNGANTLASYSYDDTTGGNKGKGRRTGMSDAGGTVSYTYDSWGRNTKEDRVIDSNTYTTQYAYDGADRVTTITYPTTETVTQTYNGRGLPYTLSGSVAGTLVSSTLYNQMGQGTQIDLGNGLRSLTNYYGLDTLDSGDASNYYGKLYRIKTYKVSDGTTLQHQKYSWDAGGNLSSRQDAVASETESFTYDNLSRLVAASGPYTESFAYDTLGNMTSKNSVSYTYAPLQPHAVVGVGSYTEHYDLNGNMDTRADATGSQTISWNVENQLSQIVGSGGYSGTSTYTYDGDGRRIKKAEGGNTIVYVGRYYEKNITTSTETSHYYLGGQQVAIKKGSTLEYLHQDSLNSTSVSTTSTGAQQSTIRYFPYGATRSSTGTLGTDQQYTGQRLDGTGLYYYGARYYYYGARYYDPQIGRFISPDQVTHSGPLPFGKTIDALTVSYDGPWALTSKSNLPALPAVVDPQEHNRYTYVLNNPFKYTDPTGNQVQVGVLVPVLVGAGPVGWTILGILGIGLVGYVVYRYEDSQPIQSAKTATGKLIEDITAHPEGWRLVDRQMPVPATGKKYLRGTSIEEVWENADGQRLERHIIYDENGNIVHDHYRGTDNDQSDQDEGGDEEYAE
ncbi:MAG: hypothetical protein HYX87_06710 [Chloroflexi bacterium]|nr:hypothetical protein [Chloroflexota bacterium]